MNQTDPSPVSLILDFWFGSLDADGRADQQHTSSWFKKDPAFDQKIVEHFSEIYSQLTTGSRPAWVTDPAGLLSAIIVLDQFSRNMFRDSPKMYSFDDLALRYSFEFIALGLDEGAPLAHRIFSYMPLMHSERLIDQERCVTLFSRFADELQGEPASIIRGNVKYAIAHRDIVARFGRFPHRNALLGRTSTEAEITFLNEPGSSF
jgi:uncharacterized protein (DUF924 family)